MEPICVKAGEGDLNGYMYKFMLLITIIIIINLKFFIYLFILFYLFLFFYFLFYFIFIHLFFCTKVGEGGLQGLMYKLILIIITTTTTKCQCTVQFIILRGACLYCSDILLACVVLWHLPSRHMVTNNRCSLVKLSLPQDYTVVHYSSHYVALSLLWQD